MLGPSCHRPYRNTLGLNLMLMTLMLPRGPLRREKKEPSAHSRISASVRQSCRDNPEGPIQINTLLLTSSQTCSLHYHSIKTAYLNRPGLRPGWRGPSDCLSWGCAGERAAEVEAPRWDVEPLTDERGEEGTGSALPIREVRASNKTGHNIAAQGSDEYLTANRGGLEMQREAFRGRAPRVTHAKHACFVRAHVPSATRALLLVAAIVMESPPLKAISFFYTLEL